MPPDLATLTEPDPVIEKLIDDAVRVLLEADEVTVACHIWPDGDALGSLLAMGQALRDAGKKVVCTWGSEHLDAPAQYSFLTGQDLLTPPTGIPPIRVGVALDCASEERLGILEKPMLDAPVLINVDHHVSNTAFGTIDLVDGNAPSTSELVLRLLERMQTPITSGIATCIYVGLVTDTGRFSYANVTPRAHAVAGHLISLGVKVDEISQAVFESVPYGYLRTLGRVLERVVLHPDPTFVVSYLTQEDLADGGITMDDTDDFIDHVRRVRESDIACFLKQTAEGRWKVSLRSKGATDVGAIAKALGGGGHTLAAGCTLGSDLSEAIERIKTTISEGARAAN